MFSIQLETLNSNRIKFLFVFIKFIGFVKDFDNFS